MNAISLQNLDISYGAAKVVSGVNIGNLRSRGDPKNHPIPRSLDSKRLVDLESGGEIRNEIRDRLHQPQCVCATLSLKTDRETPLQQPHDTVLKPHVVGLKVGWVGD